MAAHACGTWRVEGPLSCPQQPAQPRHIQVAPKEVGTCRSTTTTEGLFEVFHNKIHAPLGHFRPGYVARPRAAV